MLNSSAFWPLGEELLRGHHARPNRPPRRTKIRSAERTLENRSETSSTVRPRAMVLIRSNSSCSARGSRAAVGSSKITKGTARKKARASATRCHCPMKSSSPPSNRRLSMVSQASGGTARNSSAPESRAAPAALTDSLPPRWLRQRAGRPRPAGPGALEPALQRLRQLGVHRTWRARSPFCRNTEGAIASRLLAVAGIDSTPGAASIPSGDYTT